MRNVIYLLLVLNLLIFSWYMVELRQQEGMVRSLPSIPALASPLVTVREMEEEPEPVTEPEPKSEIDPELLEPIEQQALIESLTELQPPGGGGAITCRTLGPIMAVAELKSLGIQLDELGLEPRHRTSEQQDITGYWVFLPAMKYSAAMNIKRALDTRKDKEYFIGEGNFISLGSFREKSRADIRIAQVSKMGLEPVLEPRYEMQTVHWLDIDRQTSDAVDLGFVMEEYPGVKLQEQFCY